MPSNRAIRKRMAMVDYFASQMDGFRKEFTSSDLTGSGAMSASGYRLLTAGMAIGKSRKGHSTPRDYHFVPRLTNHRSNFTCTGPHMLSRVLTNCLLQGRAGWRMDLAAVLRRRSNLSRRT